MTALADGIDALLPQTQCTRCGFPSCRAYASAIASGEARIDRCAPGGQSGIDALAARLDLASIALDPAFGSEAPPTVAQIVEDTCIGCTKCIQACPVDAIVGAARRMHTVIADECTGCGLCLPPCPVDCIVMVASADEPLDRAAILGRAGHARARYVTREARLARQQEARLLKRQTCTVAASAGVPPITRSAVLEAIARGKARRLAKPASRG